MESKAGVYRLPAEGIKMRVLSKEVVWRPWKGKLIY